MNMWESFLSEEELELKKLSRKIAEEKIKPVRDELDRENKFPAELMKEFADLGLFGIFVPEEYGGFGFKCMNMVLVVEELSRICGGVAVSFAAVGLGTLPILLFGNEEQKKKYLPQIAEGKKLAAFALTEPEAGSDAGAVKTVAIKKGDRYIVNGVKHFITNGGEADIYVVFVNTNPKKGMRGMSALIVEKGTPGFKFGKKEDKLGIRASATRELIFEDAEVPVENLLGREGMGFRIAMETFDLSRPAIGAQAVGIAQGAFEEAIKYAKQRKQFGQTIVSFQGIQFMLADMATKIETARSLVYWVSRYIDKTNGKAPDIAKYSAMAKVFASEMAVEVTNKAIQILGGYGYMKEYPVEKYFRDARITPIYEGTNEIQRLVIIRRLIREF